MIKIDSKKKQVEIEGTVDLIIRELFDLIWFLKKHDENLDFFMNRIFDDEVSLKILRQSAKEIEKNYDDDKFTIAKMLLAYHAIEQKKDLTKCKPEKIYKLLKAVLDSMDGKDVD